ncbi:MAG: AAA family ATPase [Deinococcota bacterium]
MNETLKSLLTALEHSPDNPHMRLLVAESYAANGYPNEALEQYGMLLEQGKLHDKVLVPAGLIAVSLGDIERARNYLEIAHKLELDARELEDKLDSILLKASVPATPASPEPFEDALELDPTITFDDVGGLDEVKANIERRIILPFRRPELYAKYGKKAGGGVLMYGPPGCGKTMLARATAGACELPLLSVRIERILSKWIGESEQNIHAVFELARRKAPCVIFIDELDALAFSRRQQTSNYMRGLVDQLLQELDGTHADNENILIMAATNAPWDIDDAMLRPGRFDRRLFVPPPDETARRSILRLTLENRHADTIDTKRLAKLTPLFSGADLNGLVEQAVELVIDEAIRTGDDPPLAMKHLEKSLTDLTPSTLTWLRRAKNHVDFANQDHKYDEVADYLKRPEARRLKL